MKPQLLIGALNSGSGKTTFTMGLLRSLQKQGLQVQPFKCGPDYIDTKFHTIATGRESVNLDTWLASKEYVSRIYRLYGTGADVCIIEGVMGLFDGYDRMTGSSAEMAMLLNIPVVLVINASSTAYTVAAQIYGVKHFCPNLKLAGVVFNRVASNNHFSFLRDACTDAGTRCFGYIPKSEGLEIPSRHLGLTLSVREQMDEQIEKSAALVSRYVDTEMILRACKCSFTDERPQTSLHFERGLKIAAAKDEAFNFIYRDNIAALERIGRITYFSPLMGEMLPQADLVYLPGGYPELFAECLQRQHGLMGELRKYAETGGKILAECGGMIFLSKGITDKEGKKRYSFCGILPFECSMEHARLHLGYRRIEDLQGRSWRGHEFHYSDIADTSLLPTSVARQYNIKGERVNTALFRYKNVIAGYTHLYWGETDILKLWE